MRAVSKAWVIGAASCSVAIACLSASGQQVILNRVWWHSASEAEQTGFVLGFSDCPTGPMLVSGLNTRDYITFIDSHTQGSAGLTRDAIPKAFRLATRSLASRPILRGGEEYPEKHGWLDGAWWGDSAHGDLDERRGYVEGYLQCDSGSITRSQTQRYVAAINLHFANSSNEHHKIANVLQPILDRKRGRS